jgi:5'(3')-deoxyribonucleotidase
MKTIAWDVDDVLNNLTKRWLIYWKNNNPLCKISFNQLTENPPHKVINIPLKQYLKSLDKFRMSKNYMQLKPSKIMLNWFAQNGHKFRNIALTSVPFFAAPISANWVLKHFGNWIRTFHFVPSKRKNEKILKYDTNKIDFLNWIEKVDFIIDDKEDIICKAKEFGIKAILFPAPWNSNKNKSPEIILKEIN